MGFLQLKEHVCLPPMIFSLFFEKMWKVEDDPHLCDFFLKGFTAENLKHRFFGKMQKLNAHRRACICQELVTWHEYDLIVSLPPQNFFLKLANFTDPVAAILSVFLIFTKSKL